MWTSIGGSEPLTSRMANQLDWPDIHEHGAIFTI